MRILRKGTSNAKSLAYMTLVLPILEYGATCWDPYRESQIREIDRVQRKAAVFDHHINKPTWETLASRRKIGRVGVLYKAYCGEGSWTDVGKRLERPPYLSRAEHNRKIRSRRQRTDREILFRKQYHRGLEPVACRSVRTSPMQFNCF